MFRGTSKARESSSSGILSPERNTVRPPLTNAQRVLRLSCSFRGNRCSARFVVVVTTKAEWRRYIFIARDLFLRLNST